MVELKIHFINQIPSANGHDINISFNIALHLSWPGTFYRAFLQGQFSM